MCAERFLRLLGFFEEVALVVFAQCFSANVSNARVGSDEPLLINHSPEGRFL